MNNLEVPLSAEHNYVDWLVIDSYRKANLCDGLDDLAVLDQLYRLLEDLGDQTCSENFWLIYQTFRDSDRSVEAINNFRSQISHLLPNIGEEQILMLFSIIKKFDEKPGYSEDISVVDLTRLLNGLPVNVNPEAGLEPQVSPESDLLDLAVVSLFIVGLTAAMFYSTSTDKFILFCSFLLSLPIAWCAGLYTAAKTSVDVHDVLSDTVLPPLPEDEQVKPEVREVESVVPVSCQERVSVLE